MQWAAEKGEYEAHFASSAEHIRGRVTFILAAPFSWTSVDRRIVIGKNQIVTTFGRRSDVSLLN